MMLISVFRHVQAGEYALHWGPGAGMVMHAPFAEHPSAILKAHILPLPQSVSVVQEPLPPWFVEDHNDGFIVEDWNPFTLGIPFRGSKTLIGLVLINEVCSRLPLL